MEPQPQSERKKNSPFLIVAVVGIIIMLAGVAVIVLCKGVNFITPILSEPGPTNTMIESIHEAESSLNQPGILGEIKSFDIDGANFKFTPNQIIVNSGDTVQLNFINSQGMHNLVIEGLNIQTKTIQTGQSEQLTFVAPKKGTYRFYCSVGNHQAMGMEGILVVN